MAGLDRDWLEQVRAQLELDTTLPTGAMRDNALAQAALQRLEVMLTEAGVGPVGLIQGYITRLSAIGMAAGTAFAEELPGFVAMAVEDRKTGRGRVGYLPGQPAGWA